MGERSTGDETHSLSVYCAGLERPDAVDFLTSSNRIEIELGYKTSALFSTGSAAC